MAAARMTASDDGVLTVGGDVDEPLLPALRRHLDDLVAEHLEARVEVSDVDYLPSAAIGQLMLAAARARHRGRVLTITAAADCYAARLLRITGVPFDESGAV